MVSERAEAVCCAGPCRTSGWPAYRVRRGFLSLSFARARLTEGGSAGATSRFGTNGSHSRGSGTSTYSDTSSRRDPSIDWVKA
jgi:hypothetical protein